MSNILILDDDPALLQQAAAMLKPEGHTPLLISRSEFLFKRLESEPVDLILLDIHLPGTDGVSLLEQIKAHSLYQKIPVIILTGETDHQVLAKCFALNASDFINKPIERLVLKARVEAALAVKASKEKLEYLVKERTAELKMTNEQLHQEIEERKQIEKDLIVAKEKAEESNRLKSSFFTNISHELRTPMNSIIGFATILAEQLLDTTHQNFAERIIENGARLLNTLNDVLKLSKLEANKQNLKLASINLLQACQEITVFLKPIATQKGISLEIESQDSRICAKLDREAFTHIMNNLIGNAIKFTQKGGVQVTIGQQENQGRPLAVIRVIDSGIGMSPRFLPFIFNEFEQESDGYRRSFDGAGIGLSIAKKLAELMNGELTVTSEEGVGSTFAVTFPLWQVSPHNDNLRSKDP